MPTTTRSRRAKALAAVCAFALLATACGDDDDTEASSGDDPGTTLAEGEPASGEFDDYCSAIAAMEESEGFDAALYERIKEVAPEEIRAEIGHVADAFIAAEGDFGAALADPAVEEMLGPIEDFEAEHCEDGDDAEQAAVTPGYEEYCAYVEELDGKDAPPTIEEMERLKEIRPETVAEDNDFVADAFIAADGDVGQLFSDPAVEGAFGRIEAHDAEHCGFETEEDGEEEMATEPLEGAEVIPVVGVDFAFEGIPAEVPSGPVSFEFSNEGEAAHEMAVFKLGDGADLDELLSRDSEPSDEEAQEVGFTFAPPGEGGAYLNAEDLTPGTYAVVCFIPGPGGEPHYDLGMKTTFTVG